MKRGDGDKIVKGNDGRGFECAAHFPNNLILGNLQGFDKTLNPRVISI